jgi:apolipoprotein N-acyltransferase
MRFDLDAAEDPLRLSLHWRGTGDLSESGSVAASSQRSLELLLATPICFEDTVSSVCRRMVYEHGIKKAQAFVNLSNDGWFGDDDAARAQHGQIARFRCIENRVPMMRVVNTGSSIAIDSRGNLVAALGGGRYGEPRRSGGLLASLQLDDRSTLFGRVGDLWAWLCLIGAASIVLFTWLGAAPGTQPKDS